MMEGVRNVLKVSELNNCVKERAYQEILRGKYEVWRGGEVESVEKEWEKFSDMVMECTNDVHMWHETCRRAEKKGSEWWNEEVGMAVAEKRRAFEEWLQRRDRVTYDRYRAHRVVEKLAVQAQKKNRGPAMGERLGNDFEGNKKMFFKGVKRVRKGEQARQEMVKDVNCQILRDGVEVRRRWAEDFEQVLNVADVREANFNVVGN